MTDLNVLTVTGGHPFDEVAFAEMLGQMSGIRARQVAHPLAVDALAPAELKDVSAVLFYDMAGIPGTGVPDGSDAQGQPSSAYRRHIEALLDRGAGVVLLNHANVSWPHWPLWRQITGSSFLLQAHESGTPGSGYRGGHGPHPNPTFRVIPEQSNHPVLHGIEQGFSITDELYLKTAEFESGVLPLLRADYEFVDSNFSPPPMASSEEQATWRHPPGSNLLVWANAAGSSPVVACELGDGPPAFTNPGFQQLVGNALRWTASAEARHWARNWRAQ